VFVATAQLKNDCWREGGSIVKVNRRDECGDDVVAVMVPLITASPRFSFAGALMTFRRSPG
jgi:hypothetical protein